MVTNLRASNALCCCEYIDNDGRRNHILTCCCNCVELDRAIDSICCCRSEKGPGWDRVMQTIMDRLRVPWTGGAKQISCDVILPMILLPILFTFGAQSFPCTAVAFLAMPLLIVLLHKGSFRAISKTRFFCAWTYTSLGLIFLIYEFIVVPFLEISNIENLVFIVTAVISVATLYKVHTCHERHKNVDIESSSMHLSGSSTCNACGTLSAPRMGHCNICQKCVPKRELHCLWFGCCIGSHNLLWFLGCLLVLSINLLFGSNLILTTVCRPYRVWGSLLLPEDCSEVYYEFRYAVCFVSGLYSLMMSVLAVFAFVRQCWFISLGVTVNEWRIMPLAHILRLGITAHRPYSHGLMGNWYYLLTGQNIGK